MIERPIRAAGIAVLWQSFQMGGVKIIYMTRLLVLAILLTPSDFGMIAIAISATGFLNNLTNFGLIPAMVQAESLDEEKYDAVWTFELIRSLLVTTLTIAFAPLIANLFAEPLAVPLIQVLAFRPTLEALISIKVVSHNRNLSFRPLAFLKIVEAIVNALISISLAKTFGVWAMIYGVLGGAAGMVITSYFMAPYRPRILFRWQAVKTLLRFGGWILVTSVIAMIGNYGLRIVISRQLGSAGLGLYFLAAQLAFIPSEIASEVIGNVAFPLFARLQSNIQQAAKVFQAILTGMLALLFPIASLILILTPVMVQEILGPEWYDTVPLIQLMAVATMISLLTDATIPLVKGFGQPYRITQIELVQSTLIIFFVWLFTSRFGVNGSALAWIPTAMVVHIMSWFFIATIFRRGFIGLIKPLLAVFVSTLAGSAVSGAVITVLPTILGMILAGALSVVVTGGILWFADQRFSLGLVRNILVVFPRAAAIFKIQGVEVH